MFSFLKFLFLKCWIFAGFVLYTQCFHLPQTLKYRVHIHGNFDLFIYTKIPSYQTRRFLLTCCSFGFIWPTTNIVKLNNWTTLRILPFCNHSTQKAIWGVKCLSSLDKFNAMPQCTCLHNVKSRLQLFGAFLKAWSKKVQ